MPRVLPEIQYDAKGVPIVTSDVTSLKLEKLRRLQEEGMRYYIPHDGQKAFHESQAEIRGLFGGNQSGKSFSGANEILWTIGKVHPYRKNHSGPVFARDCCVTFGVLQAVLIPTYKRLMPRKPCLLSGPTFEGRERWWPGLRGGEWDKAYDKLERIIYLADGSFIEFKSYDQAVDSFAGPPRHIIRMDEEPPEQIFNENQARQVTVGRNIMFTMTPLNYSQWLYGNVYEKASRDPKIDVFMMKSADNPHADPAVLKAMEEDISDPIERAARLEGQFTYSQGRVWKEYGDHNLYEPFPIPKHWHRSVVIDPHPEKPVGVNWIAEDPEGRMFVYQEANISGYVDDVCEEIISRCGGHSIDLWLIDPASRSGNTLMRGRSETGQKITTYDLFKKNFPQIRLANNDRDVGIDIVRKMVRDDPVRGPKLFVSRDCPVTDHQMRNYSWKPPTASGERRSKPEVVKKNDEHPDNIRYRCAHGMKRRGKSFRGWDSMGVYAN